MRKRSDAEFFRLVAVETDEHVLWTMTTAKGYGQARFSGLRRVVHAVALEHHVGPPPSTEHLACHMPGIKCPRHCMNYRHLYWGTQRDNLADRKIDGTELLGTRNGRAVLDEDRVRELRRRRARGETLAALAVAYGIGESQVSRIVRRQHWDWLQ